MKRALLGAVAAWVLLAGQASAAMLVTDPIVEANTLQSLIKEAVAAGKRVEMVNNQIIQITHLIQTVSAVAHGNVAAIGSLGPELSALGISNPLGSDVGDLAKALGGLAGQLGTTGLLTEQLLQSDRYYGPTASDWRAAALNQLSAQLAARKAVAQQALQSSTNRLTALQNLRSQLDSKVGDVAAAGQANARIAAENGITQVQANQLAAARMLSEANTSTTQAREEQMLRCSADRFVAQAQAAATAAYSGTVTLISTSSTSSSTTCTVSTSTTTPSTDSTGTVMTSLSSGSGMSSSALNTMLGQSWGPQAADNASALGVNPTALAATCVLESGCSANVGGTGTISGAFQMTNGTYAETVSAVQASNPDLASQITTKNDPESQSIAASQYLKQGAQTLQAAGVSDPTTLDVRGYYQFGPRNAASLAGAADNQLMMTTVSGLSNSTLAANNITSSTTVGQWRQSVINKIGSAASQPVLLGSNT